MQDEKDDLDLGGLQQPDQTVDMHEWLDAAIRATVIAEHGFHKAPPTATVDWPDTQDSEQGSEQEPEQGPEEDRQETRQETRQDNRQDNLRQSLQDAADDIGPPPFTPASAVRLRDRGVTAGPPLRKSLKPVRVPQPRQSSRRRRVPPLLLYGPVIGGAAVVAYGIAVWGSPPLRNVAMADARPIAIDAQTEVQLAPHLIVHDQHVMANEPLPLEVSIDRTVPNASLRVAGLASGTHLSAGSPIGDSGWNVPFDGLKNLYMYAPTDFVGVMNSAVDLRGPDEKLIDRRKVKLEWVEPKKPLEKPMSLVPPPPPAASVAAPPIVDSTPPAMSAEVVASLLQRGVDYLKNGDIASARIVLTRLAAAGVADGAFAAGQSYDSAYLSAHNVVGVGGDEAKARAFYQRAVQLGSTEAAAQLERAATAK